MNGRTNRNVCASLVRRLDGATRIGCVLLAGLFVFSPAAAQLAAPATELPKLSGVSDSQARQWTRSGERLLFLTGPLSGGILWTTDGTAAGTAAALNGVDEILAASAGQLWVYRGPELWWTNGNADSEAEHKLLATGAQYHGRYRNDGPLLFSRIENGAHELLRVSNDEVDRVAGLFPSRLAFTDDRVFLVDGNELWTLGPAEQQAQLVATIDGLVGELLATERFAYWVVDRVDDPDELWRSDGVGAEFVAALPDRHPLIDVAARGDSMFWRAQDALGPEGLVGNLWQFDDAEAQPEQRTFFLPTLEAGDQEEGVTSLDVFARTSDGVFFMQQFGEQRRFVFLADGSTSVTSIHEPCESCDDPAPAAVMDHGLLFTERPLGPDHLWHTVGTQASTRRLFTCRVHPCGTLVEDLGFVASNFDQEPPGLTVVDPVTGATRGRLDQGAPFDAFRPEGGFVPPSTFVTSLPLGTGDQPAAVDLETGEATPLGDFVDGSNRTPQVLPSARNDLTYSAMTPSGPALGRLGVGPETSFLTQREPSSLFQTGVLRIALEDVAVSTSVTGVYVQDLEEPTPRRMIWPQRASESTWVPISENLAVFRYPDFGAGTDGVVATDGTAEGTRTLLTEDATLSLVDANDANLVYVVKRSNFDLLGVFQTDGTPEGTSSLVDLTQEPVELTSRDGQVLTAAWIYFPTEGDQPLLRIHRTTGAVEAIEVPGEELQVFLAAGDRLEMVVFRDGRRDWLRLDDSASTPLLIASLPEEPHEHLSSGRSAVLDGVTVLFLQESVRWFTDDGRYGRHEIAVRSGHAVSADRKSVFFGAEAGELGWEAWRIQSDDLEPRLVHDLRPGPASSEPQQWTLAGETIYFSANDGLLGPQIWKMETGSSNCEPSDRALCLNDDQFQIDVVVSDSLGNARRAPSRPITDDTGSFWFFDPANLELMVKVLDGQVINDHFWTFFGSLTDVEFFLTVTDAASGRARRYGNRPGNFASLGDTRSISGGASNGSALVDVPLSVAQAAVVEEGEPGPCATGPEVLCLQEDRFEVSVTWTDFEGTSGPGLSRTLEEDTGAFWFFAEENLELMVKVLDARAINGHFWVYYGALSNVGFELRVRDTATGAVRTYRNEPREFASAGDVTAFSALP